MGLFSRAFSSALKAAGRSHNEAAALTGLSQGSISRIAAGDSLPDRSNLAKLLLAVSVEDRMNCLRQYLLQHTPEEFQGRMKLTFGEPEQTELEQLDNLSSALRFLDKEATQDRHLELVLLNLARCFSGENSLSYDTAEEVELTEAANRGKLSEIEPGSSSRLATEPESEAIGPKRGKPRGPNLRQ